MSPPTIDEHAEGSAGQERRGGGAEVGGDPVGGDVGDHRAVGSGSRGRSRWRPPASASSWATCRRRAGCRRRPARRRSAARRRSDPRRRGRRRRRCAGRPGEAGPVRPRHTAAIAARSSSLVASQTANARAVGEPRGDGGGTGELDDIADTGVDEVIGRPRRRRRPAGVATADRRRRRRARRRPGKPGRGEGAPAPAAPARRSPAGRPPARGPSCRAAASRSCGHGGAPGHRPPSRRAGGRARRQVPGSDVDDHRAGAIGGWTADGHRHRPERGRHLSGDLERSRAVVGDDQPLEHHGQSGSSAPASVRATRCHRTSPQGLVR